MLFWNKASINTWPDFAHHVRGRQDKLLVRLDDYEDSILITGCQRSGSTMLARVITKTDGMTNYWFGKDDELDAALILSGKIKETPRGRYCFQTTYLNERYKEYYDHPNHRIVWCLRNPHSVVYSMVYNWRRFALNELFLQCGYSYMDYRDRVNYQRFGLLGIQPIRRAAYAYVGKVSQLFELESSYPKGRLTVIEYDRLVSDKTRLLPELYQRLALEYKDAYAAPISQRSMAKKNKLSAMENDVVVELCSPVYQRALGLVNLK